MFLVGSAFAQDAPIIRKGVTEVGGFVGASYGGVTAVDRTRVMGGGNIVYSLTRVLMPFAEFSYFPGIPREGVPVPGTNRISQNFSSPIDDFNFGFHVRIPIPKSRIIPYGVISFGGIHSPAKTITASYPNPFPPPAQPPIVTTPVDVPGVTDFAVSGGAGIRYYATERMGFRAEFKAYKPHGTLSDSFYRVTGGFFFQF